MASWPTRTTIPVLRSLPAPGTYLCGLTWDGRHLWHSDQEAGTIVAIDPATGSVRRILLCSRVRADLAYHDGRLCQVGGRPKRILLIDTVTGDIVDQKQVPPPSGRLCGIEMSPQGMWMCLRNPAVVQLRDFGTMSVQRELPVQGAPSGLTYVGGVVFYSDFEGEVIRAVDTKTGTLLAVASVAGRPTGMTWDGEQLWYCNFEARQFNAIHPNDVLAATA
jgi:DNA-binding beta-propeller fold protein YncE